MTFPERRTRTIRVKAEQMLFYGMFVGANDIVKAPVSPAVPPIRALIMGDSYTEGTSGVARVNAFEAYAARTARALGWSDFYGSDVGATGYLADYNEQFRTFRQRLDSDVIAFKPKVLVVAGGINDPLEGLQEEASRTFDAIRAGLPDTTVRAGAVEPVGRAGDQGAGNSRGSGGRPGFVFVDNIAKQWQTGNGTVARPNGSEMPTAGPAPMALT